jgi:hypothetical protein
MTLLGKVFTGLVFLLSVIFFSLAVAVNASHINWKQRADKFKQDASGAEERNRQLSSLLEDMKTELAIEQHARKSALASLQTQLAQAQGELQVQEATLAALQSAHTALVQTEQNTQVELKARTTDNELLRQQFKEAREDRNQIFQRLVAAKDQFNRLQGDFKTLTDRERQLAMEYTAAKEKLDVLDISPDTLLEAPNVIGRVLAVAANGTVVVSLGRDDGMRAGFTLEVHRDGQYLGRLKVRRVEDNQSIAEVLTSHQKGYIRAGDRIDTRLY